MSKTVNQLLVRMESQAKFPYLVIIKYTDENNVLHTERYANTDEDIEYEDEVYTASNFTIVPPTRTNSSISDGKITFSTIDQSWIEKVRTAKSRITCEFISCIVYDEENNIQGFEEIERIKFTLINASWDEKEIDFTMMFDDRQNLCVPCDYANSYKTPALV